MNEPFATALILIVIGALMAVSVVFSRAFERLGLPVVLLFLLLGVVGGSEGLGRVQFDDYGLAFRLGMVALVLILFDGGLNTSTRSVRAALAPASVLATVGVFLTAVLTALFARLLGLSWTVALLIGAVVSSTDAATVFAVLRGGGLRLKERVGRTLEVESGVNDPMAVILTTAVATAAMTGGAVSWSLVWQVPVQLVVGFVVGWIVGVAGREVLRRVRLSTGGLYAVLSVTVALLSFGLATEAHGSGFLAVYTAAVVLGNGHLPYQSGLRRVYEALAWMCQIGMFLMLGLLVFPSQLPPVAWQGLGIGLFLAIVARPLAVWLCLLPFRYTRRERALISFVGLRGAVPIILATIPVLYGLSEGVDAFNIVFFIVVVNAFVPGAMVRLLARRLGLDTGVTPSPAAALEINSMRDLRGEIGSFHITRELAVCDAAISQIVFPEGSSAVLIVRGEELMACKGKTVLREGDHVFVFFRHEDRAYIELLFGRAQSSDEPE